VPQLFDHAKLAKLAITPRYGEVLGAHAAVAELAEERVAAEAFASVP
jgi:hypothetical protein